MTRDEAIRLKQLIGNVQAADADAESYRTWKHPEDDVWTKIIARMKATRQELNDFIESLVK